jgi:hypothetical protein
MEVTSKEPVDMLEKRILARIEPQNRNEILYLIRNVSLFIKRIQGQQLSEEEKNYPVHPHFSHTEQKGGQNTADNLLYRLRLIDTYQLKNARYITELLTETLPVHEEQPLSTRKAQILWQLNQNPTIPKYKLAKKVGTTPRTVSKDLAELERDYALRIFLSPDPHKFHLTVKIIVFKTKSIIHTKRLEKYAISHRGFLRTFRLDQDLRQGTIIFRYPNQPEGHKMFNERVRWLHDEFFTESLTIQILGLHQFISLAMYDPTTNAYSIEPEIVSQVPFDYRKELLDALPQPRGIEYTRPFWFDQADFLLADSLYAPGPLSKSEHKQHLLQTYGINYSMKTIWKKENRLQKEKAVFPMIELRIPGFDEDLFFTIDCSPKASSQIRAISAFLPYVMVLNTNSGCALRIQRPVHTSTLTAQLIRKIHRQIGVTDVRLLRYQRSFQMPLFMNIATRWNTEEQKWFIQEGDI